MISTIKMNFNSKQLQKFQQSLLKWYNHHRRSLPWRDTSNPYYIWVSEIMLQQTQVNTVIPYYQKFIRQYPNIKDLANASLQDVLKSWEGLGYYSRARNFHQAVKQILKFYNENIPKDPSDFLKLPGVGDYIAAAVQSIAFHHPLAVVDGNVKRVLARLFQINAPVNSSKSHKLFKAQADKLLFVSNPGTFNQAMMELGAMICKPTQPICADCPVQKFCRSLKEGAAKKYPNRLASKPVPEHHVAAAIVRKKGRLLITQRKLEGLLGGLWEFPGGKVMKKETSENACIREVKEETNLKIKVDAHLTQVRHAYTHFKIKMDVYLCTYMSGNIKLNGPVDSKWIFPSKIKDYPFPKANHKFFPTFFDELSLKNRK
jgi:A/G-specific adenine glycosylase